MTPIQTKQCSLCRRHSPCDPPSPPAHSDPWLDPPAVTRWHPSAWASRLTHLRLPAYYVTSISRRATRRLAPSAMCSSPPLYLALPFVRAPAAHCAHLPVPFTWASHPLRCPCFLHFYFRYLRSFICSSAPSYISGQREPSRGMWTPEHAEITVWLRDIS